MKILVTGASGFVGRSLCAALEQNGHVLVPVVRTISSRLSTNRDYVEIGDINSSTNWMPVLGNVDAVIHLAARVHVMKETAVDPLAAFREVNVYGTERLAYQAGAAGVKRLVYVSSIKVNGEVTSDRPFRADDEVKPADAYGVSKLEAEQRLVQIAEQTGLEFVIVRPPLVYGPGVGGNIFRLLKLIDSGVPLPFGRVCNRRSFVNIDNLSDFLNVCITHPNADGKTFLVSDGHDMSTGELIANLAREMRKSIWLLPVPVFLLKFIGTLVGKRAEMDRLCGSLQLDIGKSCRILDWEPPFTVADGLHKTVAWYGSQSYGATRV